MSHLDARLEKDLNEIRIKIIDQAERVAKAVDDSIVAVQTGNEELAYTTVLNDHAVNRQMRTIDQLCHKFIAIHLPSAGPLRLLSSIIRANVELERIGDYAVTISREAMQMSHPPQGLMAREMESIGQVATLMLHQSVSAFRDLNAELAKGTKAMASQLEYSMNSVYDELMGNSEKEKIKDLLATFVIFNQIKRVSDLSKNLCEHTVFAATGEQKSNSTYNVLFVDSNGCQVAPLAEQIARKNFSNSGKYRSAAFAPGDEINPAIADFVHNRGISDEIEVSQALSSISAHDMSEINVIVCLQGGMNKGEISIPFHTSVVVWDIDQNNDPETVYRALAPNIKDLMELLRGPEAD